MGTLFLNEGTYWLLLQIARYHNKDADIYLLYNSFSLDFPIG